MGGGGGGGPGNDTKKCTIGEGAWLQHGSLGLQALGEGLEEGLEV